MSDPRVHGRLEYERPVRVGSEDVAYGSGRGDGPSPARTEYATVGARNIAMSVIVFRFQINDATAQSNCSLPTIEG